MPVWVQSSLGRKRRLAATVFMHPDKTNDLAKYPARRAVHQLQEATGPIAQFFFAGVLGMLGVVALVSGISGGVLPVPLAAGLVVFVSAMLIATAGLVKTYPHRAIGWCNAVTVFRLTLASVLAAWLFTPPASPWIVFWIAILAFALDGVDGWFARREGRVSDFGARFDMEVDALLAIVIAVHAFLHGEVGALVLLLGLPRYAFLLAQFAFPWLGDDLPPRYSRKVVCVVQIGVLIVLLAPGLGALVANGLVIAALAVVGWSFWVDVTWLKRARA